MSMQIVFCYRCILNMDFLNENVPRMKKRYKLILDPQYRKEWTSSKTHTSWMKRLSETNVVTNLSKYEWHKNVYS